VCIFTIVHSFWCLHACTVRGLSSGLGKYWYYFITTLTVVSMQVSGCSIQSYIPKDLPVASLGSLGVFLVFF
jgi:hypothetical protein